MNTRVLATGAMAIVVATFIGCRTPAGPGPAPGAADGPDAAPIQPVETVSSELATSRVEVGALPAAAGFLLSVAVENRSDAGFDFDAGNVFFVARRRWHSANVLEGVALEVLVGVEPAEAHGGPSIPAAELEPGGGGSGVVALEHRLGGAYVTNHETGELRLISGDLSLDELLKLERDPATAVALVNRLPAAAGGAVEGPEPVSAPRSGTVVVTAGRDVHVLDFTSD